MKNIFLSSCLVICLSSFAAADWVKQCGTLKQIASANGVSCGVSKEKNIWCATEGINSKSPAWKKIPKPTGSPPKQMSVWGHELFLITEDNSVYRAYLNCEDTKWTKTNGYLKQISHDATQVCGPNAQDEIFCSNYAPHKKTCKRNSCSNTCVPEYTLDQSHLPFARFADPGRLSQLVIRSGKMVGVNWDDIFFTGNTNSMAAQFVDDKVATQYKFKHVAYDHETKRTCGIQASNAIFCSVNGGPWSQLPGALTNMQLYNNKAYGTNANNEIYFQQF